MYAANLSEKRLTEFWERVIAGDKDERNVAFFDLKAVATDQKDFFFVTVNPQNKRAKEFFSQLLASQSKEGIKWEQFFKPLPN